MREQSKIPPIGDFHLYTHAGCMDGSASAILFRHAGGKKENTHWVPAGRADDVLSKSTAINDSNIPILLVDISPSTVEFARFLVARGNVWIIDHHKTATFLNGMHPNFFVDEANEACGCENFRRFLVACDIGPRFNGVMNVVPGFNDDHYKRFTRIIDDHDRWQLKIPFSIELPKFFAFVGQKDFVERMMNLQERFAIEKDSYWTPFEADLMAIIRRVQESKYRSAFEKMQVVPRRFLGKDVTAAYLISDEVNNSEMLNLYLTEHPEVDVAIQISFGLQKVSMRSNGQIDVAELCKQYGGGGHKSAAGHPLPKGMIAEIIGGVHGVAGR